MSGQDGRLELEQHRVRLTAYYYRILSSAFEVADAAQETLVLAWRSIERFVESFERYDLDAPTSLLYEDATGRCHHSRSGSEVTSTSRASASSGELEPRERHDRGEVRLDEGCQVADYGLAPASLEEPTEALSVRRDTGPSHSADGQHDRVLLRKLSQHTDSRLTDSETLVGRHRVADRGPKYPRQQDV